LSGGPVSVSIVRSQDPADARRAVELLGSDRTHPGDLVIDHGLCDGCRLCLVARPVDALSYGDLLDCDDEACIRCFCCAEVCTRGALGKQF
jgi:heterodisulfide reductase subunit A-like polyferredoxin